MYGNRAAAILLLALAAGRGAAADGHDARLVNAIKAGDQEAVRTLARDRALVTAREADGTTALHWAARVDALDVVQLLLRAGANADAANRYGVTPVALAAVNGSAPV